MIRFEVVKKSILYFDELKKSKITQILINSRFILENPYTNELI